MSTRYRGRGACVCVYVCVCVCVCVCVRTVLAYVDHGRPTGRQQRARAGARDAGGRVDTPRPIGHDKVLVAAQRARRIHDHRRPLGREAVLVRVARDGGHAVHPKVNRLEREAATPTIKSGPRFAAPLPWQTHSNIVTCMRVRINQTNTNRETYPAFSMKGTRKPPRQQSTWRPIRWRRASLARASMSSTAPCGKLGAEPTI
jgi:hypothetical protein